MVRTQVAVIKGTDPSEMVKTALELIEAREEINTEDRVLIKPNYVIAREPSSGITTDHRIVGEIIDFVERAGVEDIVVGEGGFSYTDRAFEVVGVKNAITHKKVRLVNLNRDKRMIVQIQNPLVLKKVGVAKTVLESTCIINLPKLKVHSMALVTLCLKNLMGFILPKSIMHSHINEKIVDLASIFKDKVKINIIDGLIGSEFDETRGIPVKTEVIIAGKDMVAVDTIGTMIMGIEPKRVRYLRLAEEHELGISNPNKIDILGEKVLKVRKKFRVPNSLSSKFK